MPHRVCPWWAGYFLTSPLRKWIHNPAAILEPFVSEGMVVLEPGPGMGFFTLELARRVGPNGRVVAIDVQPKMLSGLRRRAAKAGLADRIDVRLPKGDRLGIEEYAGKIDFALAFAVVHEIPNQAALFADITQALKKGGRVLLAEPVGHVDTDEYQAILNRAKAAGLELESQPVIPRSRAAVLLRV